MCEVSITNISATGSPNPDQITVTVAVDECKFLEVTLGGITKTVEVDQPIVVVDFVAGVDYDLDQFECDRTTVRVQARCTDADADCPPSVVTLDPLVCGEGCPTVDIDVLDVGDCVGGQRPVTLRATVLNAPDPTVYSWAYGNGEDDSELLSGTQVQVTRSFPAGTATAFTSSFGFILPENCPPRDVQIGPFAECPAVCPSATIEVRGIGDCVDGQRTVSYRVSVTAAADPVTFSVDHDDGTFGPPQAIAAGGTVSEDRTHTYFTPDETGPGATYTLYVVAVPEVPGCPGTLASAGVTIEPCVVDCADYEVTLAVALGDCGNSDATRPVTATANTVAADAPVGYEWVWSDGTELTTTQPTVTHMFGTADTGEGSVAVRAVWTNGCSDLATVDVEVQSCGCEATDWSEWSECDNCEQRRTRTLNDCTIETETRSCTQQPSPWTPWRWTWFCGSSRSRRGRDCNTETQSRVNWCCVWMWITLGLIAATGILIFIALCMLPATFWSALSAVASGGGLAPDWAALTATNIGMLIASGMALLASIVSLVLWLIFCISGNARDAACFLLGIFVLVMGWLTVISGAVAFVLWVIATLCALNLVCLFQAVGCAVGATIDVAWFGVILGVAVIIQSFLCGEQD